MTLATLTALTEGLPAEVSARVAEEPELFLTMAEAVLDAPEEATILVDKEHPLGANYVPEALVPLDGSGLPVDREEMQVTARVLAPLEEMVRAASEDGVRLNIISAYRSYDYQERLFAYWVEELGREEAERVSARAGTSQHQLGTTIDFGYLDRSFAEDPRGTWLAENAGRFGFSLSYPEGYEEVTGYSFEPWHYRWITPEAVSFQNAFFGGIQQYMLEFLHANGEALRAHRELGGES
jgi:D-alanyl-D-alanine carboxypeptidase